VSAGKNLKEIKWMTYLKSPCRCGETMGEVIGFQERVTDGAMVKYRVCWYCPECHATEKAIGRETYIDTN
jgi:hypothetical protein